MTENNSARALDGDLCCVRCPENLVKSAYPPLTLELPFPPSVNHYWRSIRIGNATRTLLSAAGRDFRKQVAQQVRAEQKALGMACGVAVAQPYLQRGDDYAPGLDKIPALCRAMRNSVLIQWQQAQLERQAEDVPPARNRAEVLTAVARVAASLGDVQRRLADSEGGGIDPACARDVRGLMGDVIEDCRVVIAILALQASHADITECMPLASLRPLKKPWWRLW